MRIGDFLCFVGSFVLRFGEADFYDSKEENLFTSVQWLVDCLDSNAILLKVDIDNFVDGVNLCGNVFAGNHFCGSRKKKNRRKNIPRSQRFSFVFHLSPI